MKKLFIATDGTQFDNELDCALYEQSMMKTQTSNKNDDSCCACSSCGEERSYTIYDTDCHEVNPVMLTSRNRKPIKYLKVNTQAGTVNVTNVFNEYGINPTGIVGVGYYVYSSYFGGWLNFNGTDEVYAEIKEIIGEIEKVRSAIVKFTNS